MALSGDACPRYTELEALMMEKNDSRYVGLLSVLFTVKGTNHVMLCPRPIYRTRDPQLVRQPSTQDALLDFMRALYLRGPFVEEGRLACVRGSWSAGEEESEGVGVDATLR